MTAVTDNRIESLSFSKVCVRFPTMTLFSVKGVTQAASLFWGKQRVRMLAVRFKYYEETDCLHVSCTRAASVARGDRLPGAQPGCRRGLNVKSGGGFHRSPPGQPWGLAFSATSPFWVCDAGTGLSTIYTVNDTNTTAFGTPNATTQPTVPGPGGTPNGVCTGIVSNTAPATTPPTFPVIAPGKAAVAASFIFVTQDGVLSAWASGADSTKAFVEKDNSATAVYKGLALVTTPVVQLYAANFKSGTIDVFDAQFNPVTLASGSFTDSTIPAGFAPFNIQNLGGKLYVTYAKQDANKLLDVVRRGQWLRRRVRYDGETAPVAGGRRHGQSVEFSVGSRHRSGHLREFRRRPGGGEFRRWPDQCLQCRYRRIRRDLAGRQRQQFSDPRFMGVSFGNGGSGGDKDTLYFTAGPGGQKHGLLGSISANPNAASVVNAAEVAGGIAPNTFVSIYGTNLAATKRTWTTQDFGANGTTLPTSLDGVSVTLNGAPAYICYISPVHINLLTPTNLATAGRVTVQVSNGTLTSNTVNSTVQATAPLFFLFDAAGHVAATHANNTPIGTATLTPPGTPAAPGELIILYGSGFGPTSPAAANGQLQTVPALLALEPVIQFNNMTGNIVWGGLSATGLYQFNITIPIGVEDGDVSVTAMTAGGVNSPINGLITIKQ